MLVLRHLLVEAGGDRCGAVLDVQLPRFDGCETSEDQSLVNSGEVLQFGRRPAIGEPWNGKLKSSHQINLNPKLKWRFPSKQV